MVETENQLQSLIYTDVDIGKWLPQDHIYIKQSMGKLLQDGEDIMRLDVIFGVRDPKYCCKVFGA